MPELLESPVSSQDPYAEQPQGSSSLGFTQRHNGAGGVTLLAGVTVVPAGKGQAFACYLGQAQWVIHHGTKSCQ